MKQPTTVSLSPLCIVGLSLRTHNAEAAATIPALWARIPGDLLARRPAEALLEPGALVAVYGDYESDHTGAYTLTVGFPVPPGYVASADLSRVEIPGATYARYEVAEPGPAGIFGAWQRVWSDSSGRRAFTWDLEIYPSDFATGGLPALFIAQA